MSRKGADPGGDRVTELIRSASLVAESPALSFTALSESVATAISQARSRSENQPIPLEQGARVFASILLCAGIANAGVLWVGNGGSAALCAHLSQDALNKLSLRSMTLGDAALLTCMANDFGFENVFARPVATLGRAGDVLIAISSSGRSPNILAAAHTALERKMRLVTFSAFDSDNPLFHLPAALAVHVPCDKYGCAEMAHGTMIHAVMDGMLNDRAISAALSKGPSPND